MIWPILALALALLALIGAGAALRARHVSKIKLARLKREAERTHAYWDAMRKVYAKQ